MLDLKGTAGRLRAGYIRALRELFAAIPLADVTVAGHDWRLLNGLQQAALPLKVCYTANTGQRLELLWQNQDALAFQTVGLHHTIVTPEVLERFKSAGVTVYAWTVDDLARARQLREMGVDGLISNDLGVLEAVKGTGISGQ
jgi:glycerophosphoryl diester phosphodiesterase